MAVNLDALEERLATYIEVELAVSERHARQAASRCRSLVAARPRLLALLDDPHWLEDLGLDRLILAAHLGEQGGDPATLSDPEFQHLREIIYRHLCEP
jgi:hypothetical protein